jgi:hypothetical protein
MMLVYMFHEKKVPVIAVPESSVAKNFAHFRTFII